MQGPLYLTCLDTLLQGREDVEVVLLRSDLFEKRAETAVGVSLPFFLAPYRKAHGLLRSGSNA